jgi:hypothetical protein
VFNYKSVFTQNFNDAIVVSFNKGDNKNYRFGFTVNQEDADFDRSVVVLEDNIHWKSDLTREISTSKKDGLTYMYNCGDRIFNEYLYIMPNPEAQDINLTSKKIYKTVFGNKVTFNYYEHIDIIKVNTCHSAFVTFENADYTPSPSDYIFNYEDKSFIKKDYTVNPIILETDRYFITPYIFDDEECILSISEENGDLVLLSTDYELIVDPKKEKISSIVTMDYDEAITIYYDRIKSDSVRFVISDFGRLISLT